MLRLMFDSSPNIAIPGESHFIPPLHAHRRRYESVKGFDAMKLAGDIVRTPHFRLWGIPGSSVLQRVASTNADFASTVDAVFSAYAEHHGKPDWGDKTPIYVLHIPLIAHLFPTARFIHLIRDGRDVALSYLSIPWGPTNIWQAAHKWRRDVSVGRRHGQMLGSERYLEVRYENLIQDPRSELNGMCSFAGLSFEEEMLDGGRQDARRLHAPAGGARWHASAVKPPTPGLRSWRTEMDAQALQSFEAMAGDLLAELGYERATSPPARARYLGAVRDGAFAARTDLSKLKKRVQFRFGGRLPAGIDS
jgi:hypothetical protein